MYWGWHGACTWGWTYILNQFFWGNTGSFALFSALGFCQLLSVGKKKPKTTKKAFHFAPVGLSPQTLSTQSQIQLSKSNGFFFSFPQSFLAEAELITSETVFSGWLQTKNVISQRSAEVSETRFHCNVDWSWEILNTVKRQQVPSLPPAPRQIPHLPLGRQSTDLHCGKHRFGWHLSRLLLTFKVCMPGNSLVCGAEWVQCLISCMPGQISGVTTQHSLPLATGVRVPGVGAPVRCLQRSKQLL